MKQRLEYTGAGTVGLIVPRESTTVEPELSVLLPPDTAVLAMKMAEIDAAPFERMRENAREIPKHVAAFGSAPIDVFAYGLTASSYLLPDDEVPTEVDHGGGKVPIVAAAWANRAALAALGVRRIALVSPYWKALTDAAVDYWTRHDIVVESVVTIGPAKAGHIIYGLRASEILAGIQQVATQGIDAILVTGTGAPSLAALAAVQGPGHIPVLSSNFCTGWAVATKLDADTAGRIEDWMSPEAPWKAELRRRYPRSVADLQIGA
jgi:maleate isomerase